MNNRVIENMYCVVSETEEISSQLIKSYYYIVQYDGESRIKIWYEDCQKIKNISIKANEGQISSCIDALYTLLWKKGIMGLDYKDVFQYMGNGDITCNFSEYLMYNLKDKPLIDEFEHIQELCQIAKKCVLLFDGCSLWDAKDILDILDRDDNEITFQVTWSDENENRDEGKLYLWTQNG